MGGTADSAWKDLGIIGNAYHYENEAWIVTNAGGSTPNFGGVDLRTVSYHDTPTGWMGVKPAVYYADGALCKSAQTYYTDKSTAEIANTTDGACGGGHSYYGQGHTYEWNNETNQYHDSTSYASPDQTAN